MGPIKDRRVVDDIVGIIGFVVVVVWINLVLLLLLELLLFRSGELLILLILLLVLMMFGVVVFLLLEDDSLRGETDRRMEEGGTGVLVEVFVPVCDHVEIEEIGGRLDDMMCIVENSRGS